MKGLEYYKSKGEASPLYKEYGKIQKSMGLVYEVLLSKATIGSICKVISPENFKNMNGYLAEVIGFHEKNVVLMPLEENHEMSSDSLVVLTDSDSKVKLDVGLLGRVINPQGNPIDSKGEIPYSNPEIRSLYAQPVDALLRNRITEPLDLGIRSINGLLTCGKGQRMGVFAGSGVGKSVLLGMMAKNTNADINVIALIGERGREVREFIENELGEEGLAKSVVIVATSDMPPLLRLRGAYLATTIAEYFRDQKKDVLLMMDSLTRFSMAQREIGLSLGEPPTAKGYTPSVFSLMPKLLERAGTTSHEGSITGLYTVLVEGDEMDDPIADSARAILDGHIVLSRKLSSRNHFPAIDVMASTSRVMPFVIQSEHKRLAAKVKEWIALYEESEDLINLGAYIKGSNVKLDQAILVRSKVLDFLKQGVEEKTGIQESLQMISSIVKLADQIKNR